MVLNFLKASLSSVMVLIHVTVNCITTSCIPQSYHPQAAMDSHPRASGKTYFDVSWGLETYYVTC